MGGKIVPLTSLGGGNVDDGGGGKVVVYGNLGGYSHMFRPQPFGPHLAATAASETTTTKATRIFLKLIFHVILAN